jgi:hypothetical protein
MKKIIHFIVLLFLLYHSPAQNISILPPVKIPVLLSGSFAELRSNHFHSGIDIKTQGITGIPVFSVADGYISRIAVSPGGFGNTLYITQYNGTTSVYAHLDRFRNDIQEYIKNIQYEKESFRVDVPVPENQFRVKQGEEIAKSGNSGSSGGPHLHFEIRDTKTEEPLNPLGFALPVTDNQPPKIFNILLVPLNENSHVNFQQAKKSYPVIFSNGKYQLQGISKIPVFGEIGFAVEANDYFDNTTNKCGLNSIELIINGELYFSILLDRFSFDDTRYINSYIDYEQYIRNNRRYQKTYIDSGNQLKIYSYTIGRGIFNFNDGNIHIVKLRVKDAYGNSSELEFNLESKYSNVNYVLPDYTKIFRYNEKNEYTTDNLKLTVNNGNLYNDLYFQYNSIPGKKPFYSDIHFVHNKTVPIHKNAEIKIRVNSVPRHLESKLLLVNVDTTTWKFSAAGGEFSDGWVTGNIQNFGNYAVASDSIPPVISPLSIKDKNTLTETNRIRFRISDNLAGIDKINGYINGKWALFEYDQKNNLITHYFDTSRFELNKRHQFMLNVSDYKGNTAVYEASFWK